MKNVKNKILFMAAAANDEERNLVALKERKISERLRVGENRDEFDFITKLHLRVDDVQEILLQQRLRYIVHLSAQGTKEGDIVLEDDAGRPHIVSGSPVVKMFKLLQDDTPAIILDGGYTEQLGRQLQGTFDYVVSMNGAIDSQSTVTFFTAFYQALSYGRNFVEAFNLAKNRLSFENEADSSKPVLYNRKVVGPSFERERVKFLAKTRKISSASSV